MIKQQVETLMQLSDDDFSLYLFSQDPLKNKVSEEKKKKLSKKLGTVAEK